MLSWEPTPVIAPEYGYPSLAAMRCDRAWVEIDLQALTENIRQIRRILAPQTQLLAVVKADAYGHGSVTVAKTVLAAGASWLGVATVPEGIELRAAGIKTPILILGAVHTPEQIRAIAHWQLQPTLCTSKQALIFAETLQELGQTLPVHLKIDTGMSRLGMPWQEAAAFVALIRRSPQLEIASIYSHFATADHPDPTLMNTQHQRFQRVIDQLQAMNFSLPRLHIANSAATLTNSDLHYDLVRVGLAMYGLYPAPHLQGLIRLKPVMRVKARITQIKTIPAGTGVSYGYQFIAEQDTQIAVVGIGYADGVPRNLSNQMRVLVRGQWVRQIGAVTMDQLMIDVSNLPDLQVGEVVTLLGQDGDLQVSAEDWASLLGTISWEILCGFKHRLPRVTVEGN